MNFDWLKKYAPRGLYGRAALILLVPVVALQLVVSLIFIQRHFEDVTRQMTRSLALDLQFLLQEVNTADDLRQAGLRITHLAKPLAFDVALPAKTGAAQDARNPTDLSGRIVISTVHAKVRNVSVVDLKSNSRQVRLWIDTKFGPMSVVLSRSRVSASNPHQFLVLMVFVSLLMTLVAFLFLRNQLRPILRLSRAAEAFGKGRIVPYKPSGALEVRSAGHAFLDMRARIERQIEQRTLMLSGVSHDLRTPITRLKLGLSIMEDVTEAADLTRDLEEMERLLDEFLAFARGDMLDDLVLTDPVALLRDIVAKAGRANAAVTIGMVQGDGSAMMRPIAIERALDNLISNALRYGDTVVTSVMISERAVRFSVEDDGPGIAVGDREQALKPFARLDASRNQNKGLGVGLGLSIAYDIARRHGGSLRLGESEAMGGLQVDLVLPR